MGISVKKKKNELEFLGCIEKEKALHSDYIDGDEFIVQGHAKQEMHGAEHERAVVPQVLNVIVQDLVEVQRCGTEKGSK